MGQGGFRLLFAVAASLAALAFGGSAAASTNCSSRLLTDWRDGRLDTTYPVGCYREALKSLPEDVRVYSSAPEDITRALQARLTNVRGKRPADRGNDDAGVSPLLVLAISGGILLGAGSLAALVR
jgi:hypothetical protein